MSIAGIFKHIVDSLWAVGGIGASADLGLDDLGMGDFGPWAEPCPAAASCCPAGVRGSRRPVKAAAPTPLEAELCSHCCSKPSVR